MSSVDALNEAPSGHPPFAFELVAYEDRVSSVDGKNVMECHAPLCEVLDDMQAAPDALRANYWGPSRVVRAVIDSSIGGQDRVRIVNEAAETAIDFYAGSDGASNKLSALRVNLESKGILDTIVNQRYDAVTAQSTSNGRSSSNADRLNEMLDEPMLMVPLCHGGLVPGLQTFLYHGRHRQDSALYPVRFSRAKHHDRRPFLVDEELDHLRDLSQDRTVVVYDDDSYTGETVGRMVSFFKDTLGKRKGKYIGMVSMDRRMRWSEARVRQGEHWQRSGSRLDKMISHLPS